MTGREKTPARCLPVMLAVCQLSMVLVSGMANASASATTDLDHAYRQHQYYLLRKYKLTYDAEIFDYCLDELGPLAPGLGGCMRKNDELKQRILNNARAQLDLHSRAQDIYDECLDRHPMVGVKPVGRCVDTRLYLRDKLDDEIEERRIYLKCDIKWRKHGSASVDSCARSEVTYFRRWKKYREE